MAGKGGWFHIKQLVEVMMWLMDMVAAKVDMWVWAAGLLLKIIVVKK
jgi:hypothetical protein